MDFEEIIAGLSHEIAANQAREEREEVAELAEAELVSISIADRLRALEGREVRVASVFGYSLTGVVRQANPSWLLIKDADGEELVLTHAIAVVRGLGRVAPSPTMFETKLGIAHILRRIMRKRGRVRIVVGSQTLAGYIGAVYADHVDLVGLETGEAMVSVAFAHLFSVRLVGRF